MKGAAMSWENCNVEIPPVLYLVDDCAKRQRAKRGISGIQLTANTYPTPSPTKVGKLEPEWESGNCLLEFAIQ